MCSRKYFKYVYNYSNLFSEYIWIFDFASYFVHRSSMKCSTSLQSSDKSVGVWLHREFSHPSFPVSEIITVYHRSNSSLSEIGGITSFTARSNTCTEINFLPFLFIVLFIK